MSGVQLILMNLKLRLLSSLFLLLLDLNDTIEMWSSHQARSSNCEHISHKHTLIRRKLKCMYAGTVDRLRGLTQVMQNSRSCNKNQLDMLDSNLTLFSPGLLGYLRFLSQTLLSCDLQQTCSTHHCSSSLDRNNIACEAMHHLFTWSRSNHVQVKVKSNETLDTNQRWPSSI